MIRVAVVARSRSTLRALQSACEEMGYVADAPVEPIEWSRRVGRRATLLVVRTGMDWETLAAFAEASNGHRLLAVLDDVSEDRCIEALKMGAHGIADANAEPHAIVGELAHTLDGMPRIPYPVLRKAVEQAVLTPPDIPPEDIRMLAWSIEGLTMKEIAARRRESKRHTERMLKALVRALRCQNRYEAILQAERWGLLREVTAGVDGNGSKKQLRPPS